MKLFGTILPFIGFTKLPLEQKLELGIPAHEEINVFAVEWLGFGAYLGRIGQRK